MAFTVTETTYSRASNLAFDRQSITIELFGKTTLDDAVARAGFLAVMPLVFNNLLFKDLAVSPLGGGVWKGTAQYESYVIPTNPAQGAPPPPPGVPPPPPPPPAPAATAPLGPEYSWDISGQTEHILKSIATLEKKAIDPVTGAAAIAVNNNKAIGITSKGDIQGVDRISPKAEISVTKLFEYVTMAYYKTLTDLVGSVNNATFYNFPRGELLFIGASGQPRDNGGKVAVTFKFSRAPNQTSVVITDGLTIASKRGWEYIWVGFSVVKDSVTGKTSQKPTSAYLEQIYEEKDFALLNIGV